MGFILFAAQDRIFIPSPFHRHGNVYIGHLWQRLPPHSWKTHRNFQHVWRKAAKRCFRTFGTQLEVCRIWSGNCLKQQSQQQLDLLNLGFVFWRRNNFKAFESTNEHLRSPRARNLSHWWLSILVLVSWSRSSLKLKPAHIVHRVILPFGIQMRGWVGLF